MNRERGGSGGGCAVKGEALACLARFCQESCSEKKEAIHKRHVQFCFEELCLSRRLFAHLKSADRVSEKCLMREEKR